MTRQGELEGGGRDASTRNPDNSPSVLEEFILMGSTNDKELNPNPNDAPDPNPNCDSEGTFNLESVSKDTVMPNPNYEMSTITKIYNGAETVATRVTGATLALMMALKTVVSRSPKVLDSGCTRDVLLLVGSTDSQNAINVTQVNPITLNTR